jgi:hypothetical protein
MAVNVAKEIVSITTEDNWLMLCLGITMDDPK